jgi:hypothetical protein
LSRSRRGLGKRSCGCIPAASATIRTASSIKAWRLGSPTCAASWSRCSRHSGGEAGEEEVVQNESVLFSAVPAQEGLHRGVLVHGLVRGRGASICVLSYVHFWIRWSQERGYRFGPGSPCGLFLVLV